MFPAFPCSYVGINKTDIIIPLVNCNRENDHWQTFIVTGDVAKIKPAL